MKVADKVINFRANGPQSLKVNLVIQLVKKALLILRNPVIGVVP